MHGHGVKTDPAGACGWRPCASAAPSCRRVLMAVRLGAGNIFEGDWKDGKPQLKGEKGKGLAELLPWLNETVRRCRRRSRRHPLLPFTPLQLEISRGLTRLHPHMHSQVGSVPTPSRRTGGYESVMTDDPEDRSGRY